MKRRILGYVAVMVTVICLCAAPSFAADNYKIGVGYQGMLSGNLLNGLSVRGWFGPNTAIGVEGNLIYGALTVDPSFDDQDLDADLFMFEIKAMYALIVKTNSRFYVGGKLGYGQYSIDPIKVDGDLWNPAIFVGAEWNFPSLPEVGFNFEVGYNFIFDNTELGDGDEEVDLGLHGINVGLGIKYYF
jgi:hypothetical protein